MLYVFYYLVENTFVSMLKVFVEQLQQNPGNKKTTIMYRGTCVDETMWLCNSCTFAT